MLTILLVLWLIMGPSLVVQNASLYVLILLVKMAGVVQTTGAHTNATVPNYGEEKTVVIVSIFSYFNILQFIQLNNYSNINVKLYFSYTSSLAFFGKWYCCF